MSIVEELEHCPDCGASIKVYETPCRACGADLFSFKVMLFEAIRDGGGMTEDAFEAAVEALQSGPAEAGKPAPRGERKQVEDLTLDDLARCPVWEFALDEEGEPGQDEETLRPRPDLLTPDPADGLFVLAARFRAADGTELAGYVTPDEAGKAADAPHVVTEQGQHVGFWHGSRKPSNDELGIAYQALGRRSSDLFPIQVESIVETTHGPLVDEILGFGYLDRSGESRLIV